VRCAVHRITETNNNEGFAKAVQRFILAAWAERGEVSDPATRRGG